jgi:hypothetical protein
LTVVRDQVRPHLSIVRKSFLPFRFCSCNGCTKYAVPRCAESESASKDDFIVRVVSESESGRQTKRQMDVGGEGIFKSV